MSKCRLIEVKNFQDTRSILEWLKKRGNPDNSVEEKVRSILLDVQKRGDEALLEYTRRFDCPDLKKLRVDSDEINKAVQSVSKTDLSIISEAASNIRTFHEAQKEKSWFITKEDGTILGQQVTPVDRVGLYVPGGMGGNTPLISSMLMNAVPAVVAGVREIAVVTPPRADGTVSPYILAAADMLGISEIYCTGSAWAVAALAYGTESIPAVDVIAGPGNIFVTTAKRLVQGTVGIDMIAGPSEVLVLADNSASPRVVAADMLSQAEHDPLASAICITADRKFGEEVACELDSQYKSLPRAALVEKSLENWSAVLVSEDMDASIDLANQIAPEHLEICVSDPWAILPKIRHAGAIFMGHNSPEPVGDYFAGPNHVLPTLGTARFSSALSVQTFSKKTSIIAASRSFVESKAPSIARLARLEGLEAHARSVENRLSEIKE